MTDDELWELMQRNLDNDLSPEEQQVLYTVLDKEPLLKQKYDRLQQVSQRLAELPAVTPPFSIVDSILPKLESAAATPAALAAESRDDSPTEVKRVPAQTSEGARRKPAYAWLARMGSVAVAACLLLGVLVLGDNANKQLEDDVSHNGAIVPPIESEPPAIYGPPVPPPSTDTTPTSITVEEQTVENRPKQNRPKQDPVQDQPPVQTTTAATSEQEPEQGVDEPLPPVIPQAPVVPFQQKPPAFPIGLEEKSDDYVYDRSSGAEGDEDEDDDKESKAEKKQEKEQEKREKEQEKREKEERKQSEREDD